MAALEARSAILLDHHPLWLDAVESVVTRSGVQVQGKTGDAEDALSLLGEHHPDLFIVDVETPAGELDVGRVEEAARLSPKTKVVALTGRDDPREIEDVLEAGASAFVVKTAHPDDLVAAIRQTFNHSIYLPEARPAAPRPRQAELDASGLTRRELEILRLVAEGHSNAGLARMLWVTEQTVKFHLSNIYRKLSVANRTEASRWAQRHGLLLDTDAAPAASAPASSGGSAPRLRTIGSGVSNGASPFGAAAAR